MTDLDALIAKVEELTGADRETDALIEATLFAPEGWQIIQSPINGNYCIYVGLDRLGKPRLWEAKGHRSTGNPYTSDLNAIVKLVEAKLPGWGGDLDWGADGIGARLFPPYDDLRSESRDWSNYSGIAATRPLALCLALLRALAQEEGKP